MSRFLMIVRSQPHAGEQEAFNAWYEEQHIGDLMRIPGIVSARRYEITSGGADWDGTYLGIYEIEGDPALVEAELAARRGTDRMPGNPAVVDSARTLKVIARPIGQPRD